MSNVNPIKKTKESTKKQKQNTDIAVPVYIDSDVILPSDYTEDQKEEFFHNAWVYKLATKVGDEKPIKDRQGKRIVYSCGCKGWTDDGRPICKRGLPITCQSCGRYVSKEVPDWKHCKPTDLDFLGAGVPLFFEFIKYSGYFLIILILTGGSYNFFSNSLDPDCKVPNADGEAQNHCNLNWISRFTLADKRHDQNLNDLQAILNIFSIAALIVLLQIFRTSQRIINEESDNGDISPSDYSIIIKNLPSGDASLSRDQLAEALNKEFADIPMTYKQADDYGDMHDITKLWKDLPQNEQVLSHRINLSYDTKELDKLKAQKAKYIVEYQTALKGFYAKGHEHGKDVLDGEQGFLQKIKNVEQGDIESSQNKDKANCDELEAKFYDNHPDVVNKFTGYCFISLEKEPYKNDIVYHYKKKQQFRITGKDNKEYKPEIYEATDPTDVFWENLKFTLAEKRIRRLISFIINFTTLFLCFLTIFWLSEKQRKLNIEVDPQLLSICSQAPTYHNQATTANSTASALEYAPESHKHLLIGQTEKLKEFQQDQQFASKTKDVEDFLSQEQEDQNKQLKVKILTLIISVVIIPAFNSILLKVMTYTTDFEKYTTKTENQISLATKLSIGLFFNTALQTFITKIIILWNVECLESARQAIFTDGGLIYTQENVLMMNAFQNTFVYLIDASKITQLGKKWFFLDRVSDKCTLTQNQANELSSEPPYLIAPRYAFIMNTMFTTAFYAPLIPIGLFWSLIALFITYWIEKYKILNQRSILHNITNKLSTEMTELLELFLPIYCAANLVFTYMIVKTPHEHPHTDVNPVIDMIFNGNIYAIIGIIVGIVHSILPMKEINKALISTNLSIENTHPYDEAKHNFATTYAKENPATQAGALLKEQIHNNQHHQ